MGMLSMFGLVQKQRPPQNTSEDEVNNPNPVETRKRLGPLHTNHDTPYNHNAAHAVTIRILLIIAGVSMSLNIILGVLMTELMPLHTVEPFLVTFSDHADQMVEIDPPTANISSMSIIANQEIKDYIQNRYTVTADVDETVDRWNTHVRLFSSPKVYDAFQEEVADVKDLISSEQFTRQVNIINILNTEPGLYDVDFDTYEHMGANGLSGAQDQTHHYTASIRIVMEPRQVPRSMLDLNPFGFLVVAYTVSPRQVSNQ